MSFLLNILFVSELKTVPLRVKEAPCIDTTSSMGSLLRSGPREKMEVTGRGSDCMEVWPE
jgi:hypothetical protein